MIRKIFFWFHLSAGLLAGIVIFIMCVTGVLLAWQRQIIHWADRGFRQSQIAQEARVAPETLIAKAFERRGALPTTLAIRSDPAEPAAAEFGREAVVYLNPRTGEVLGEGSARVRAFFRDVENWHRWLAAGLESRATARGITGACNVIFLGMLLSGFYLWLPKKWNSVCLRPAIWFRGGLRGRARDWNWHNTIGIWCLTPLVVIVVTGVVMSYPWANNLVYRITGSEAPRQVGGGARGGAGRADSVNSGSIALTGIDTAWRRVETQVSGWKSISMRVPTNSKMPVQFTIDSGDGGRPDLRDQLTVQRGTGDIVRWEPFRDNNTGRRLRSWIRFSHTGEAGGIPGATIASIASMGGVVLAWTGVSLALRRLRRSIASRRAAVPTPEIAGVRS